MESYDWFDDPEREQEERDKQVMKGLYENLEEVYNRWCDYVSGRIPDSEVEEVGAKFVALMNAVFWTFED
jgi:hypothetical protein